MGKKIQHKRGLKQDLPKLATSELGYTTDTEQLFVGTNNKNIRLLDEKDKTDIDTRLSENIAMSEKNQASQKKATERITNGNMKYLNYQKPILKFPVREPSDTRTWIQGVDINQDDNEFYTTRQENNGIAITIERRDLSTGAIKDTRTYSVAMYTYAEGIPWFKNESGELCFIVRTVFADLARIFNYTNGTMSDPFTLLGTTKLGMDYDKKYIVSCYSSGTMLDKIYIYDFNTIKTGAPKLLHTINTRSEDLWFEKPQAITIHEDKIIFAHGASLGTPGISVVNMRGQLEETYYFDRKSFAEMINDQYPGLITNMQNYHYENEGIFMMKHNNVVTPALLQIVNNTTSILVVCDFLDGKLVERKIVNVAQFSPWNNIPLADGVTTYAANTVPQYKVNRDGDVTLRGAVQVSGQNTVIGTLPSNLRPKYTCEFLTVGSQSSYNRIGISQNTGEIKINATTYTGTTPYTCLYGITYSIY